MKKHSLLACLSFLIFCAACDQEVVDRSADFKIKTMDNESNALNLIGTVRYRLLNRADKKLIKKYSRHYKDSLFVPAILNVSHETLKDYSAGEIYNYKRDEIEQKLGEKTKIKFKAIDIEMTAFSISSVELSDTLMKRLEREHLERVKNEKTDGKN